MLLLGLAALSLLLFDPTFGSAEFANPCASYVTSSSPADTSSAVEHLNAGHRLQAAKRVSEAIMEYCQALALEPGYETAYLDLADAAIQNNNSELAQEVVAYAESKGIKLHLPAYLERLEDQVREGQRAAAIAKAQQHEESRQQSIIDRNQAVVTSLLEKYQATNLSTYVLAYQLHQNPFVYKGKSVFLEGAYHKNIGPRQAIVAIVPDRDPSKYVVQWETTRNLAEGKSWLRCVVRVLGTTIVRQGVVDREIPHVKEIECLK